MKSTAVTSCVGQVPMLTDTPAGMFPGRLGRSAARATDGCSTGGVRGLWGVVAALAVVTAGGCGTSGATPRAVSTASPASPAASASSALPVQGTASPSASPSASPTAEVLLDGGAVVLPDSAETPGVTYVQVSQANIHQTICRTGFTKTIRPPSSYTTALKERQLASGYTYRGDTSTSDYEEDHLISLELGGAPSDPRNLWPEPYAATDGARVKDRVENKLHDLVCSGALGLSAAQHAIAGNWWEAYQRYGGEGSPTVWDGSYAGGTTTSAAPTTSTAGAGQQSATSDPSGATAQCADGTYSYSQHRSGTCSRHGGVARWINRPPA